MLFLVPLLVALLLSFVPAVVAGGGSQALHTLLKTLEGVGAAGGAMGQLVSPGRRPRDLARPHATRGISGAEPRLLGGRVPPPPSRMLCLSQGKRV